MNATVAVVHYPEGAGHATRMLAVARELAARGATVKLAGGGPGKRFVELLGDEEYVPTVVDFIGDYQGEGSLRQVLTGSVPDAARRVRDVAWWLRDVEADCVVTDDMFASMAATLARVPQYVCTHNTPGYYEDLAERAGAAALTKLQVAASRDFFYPAVWPPLDGDPAGVERVPPIALDVPATAAADRAAVSEPPDVDVLISPSTYSTALDTVAERLRERDREVTVVGGEDWEPVASMVPVLRNANVVVCPGYSTVMEAAVAGTPCVVYPFTSEQRGVARFVERGGEPGFAVATTPEEAVEHVESPPDAPDFENGASVVAERVVAEWG
jgi:UDP:flavonoid glycosyltransferase YjiC (YdhE family)